jgi:ATP-dependent RNA helicase DeaD
VCVATDVAARGLDLPDLGLVIHGDLPQNAQMLVHRSGRTGRAGKHGLAILIVPEPARRYVERMLHTAKVEVSWRAAPSAEDIRVRDHDQLVLELRTLAEEPADEDKKVAAQLLGERPAEALVAALVRIRREARPAPEELTVPMSLRPKSAPPPKKQSQSRQERRFENHGNPNGADRRRVNKGSGEGRGTHGNPSGREFRGGKGAGGVWFTVNVGRSKNADPKWLIPLLCRRGDVTKRSIGKIQILIRETRVEIAPDAADHFAQAVRRPDEKDKNIHIERLEES